MEACLSCKAAFRGDERFCTKCGHPRENEAAKKSPVNEPVNTCSKCGSSLKSDAPFCVKCGFDSRTPVGTAESASVSQTRIQNAPGPSGLSKAERYFLWLAPAAWAVTCGILFSQWGPDGFNKNPWRLLVFLMLAYLWQDEFRKNLAKNLIGRRTAWMASIVFCSIVWASGIFFIVYFTTSWAPFWILVSSTILFSTMLLPVLDAPPHSDVAGTRGIKPRFLMAFALSPAFIAGGMLLYHLSGMSGAGCETTRLGLRAMTGSVEAGENLAWMFREGRNAPQDYAQALKWFEWAANKGSVKAKYDAAVMYYYGLGIKPDREKARSYAGSAAHMGDYAPGYTLLGLIDSESDLSVGSQAFSYWNTAASKGEPWAEYYLGLGRLRLRYLDTASHNNPCVTDALYWLEKARLDGVEPVAGLLQHVWDTVADDQVEAVREEVFRRLKESNSL